jgi:hypothetical protein
MIWFGATGSGVAVDLDRLSPDEQQLLERTLAALAPLVAERKVDGTANLLTFEAFYEPLDAEQRALLDAIRAVDPATVGGSSRRQPPPPTDLALMRIAGQTITPPGASPKPLDDQYLPADVEAAYRAMMAAMLRDLGRRLLVESGYRSPAYQLYLFLFYMPKHDHSIRETNRFVALPGCSEHGAPQRQAIDFINEQGINGEDDPEAFEALPEYAWLTRHARDYGFVLSYPRNDPSGTSFEPWHWHWEPTNRP